MKALKTRGGEYSSEAKINDAVYFIFSHFKLAFSSFLFLLSVYIPLA